MVASTQMSRVHGFTLSVLLATLQCCRSEKNPPGELTVHIEATAGKARISGDALITDGNEFRIDDLRVYQDRDVLYIGDRRYAKSLWSILYSCGVINSLTDDGIHNDLTTTFSYYSELALRPNWRRTQL
jgi:hypothetical protein